MCRIIATSLISANCNIFVFVIKREATSFSSGRTLVVEELLPLRQRLQVFMRELMNGEYEVGTQEQLADLIFERYSGFINRIVSIIDTINPVIIFLFIAEFHTLRLQMMNRWKMFFNDEFYIL